MVILKVNVEKLMKIIVTVPVPVLVWYRYGADVPYKETLRFKVFNKLIKKLCQVYLDLFQWCQHKNATCFLLSR